MSIEEIEKRYDICNACPICDREHGICNSDLYLNPKNNDISTYKKDGYIKGCGCLLEFKIKKDTAKCPCGKW